MTEKLWYNLIVADYVGKKEFVVGAKVSESLRQRLDEIAAHEDRERSYVIRELMLRGLALYEVDGELRHDQRPVAHTKPRLASVPATITPGRHVQQPPEITKRDAQKMVDDVEIRPTRKIPVGRKAKA